MKTTLLSIVLLFLSYSALSQYVPMPQGWSATWTYESNYADGMGGGSTTYRYYEWGGDTLINGTLYTKRYEGIGLGHQYIGGVRQDVANEKIFYIDTFNVEHDVSFNQHLVVGDTTIIPNDTDSLYEVIQVDTSYFNGIPRKRFQLEALDYNSNPRNRTYEAGVGFTASSTVDLGGWWNNLVCHSVNHEWLYGSDAAPICFLGQNEVSLEETVQVYPNPTQGVVNLNLTPEHVEIFAADGRQMHHFSLSGNQLDIRHLDLGIYLLIIQFKEGTVVKKIQKE